MKTWVCMTKRLIAWKGTEGNQKEPYLAGIGRSRPWPVPPTDKDPGLPGSLLPIPPPQPRFPPTPYPPAGGTAMSSHPRGLWCHPDHSRISLGISIGGSRSTHPLGVRCLGLRMQLKTQITHDRNDRTRIQLNLSRAIAIPAWREGGKMSLRPQDCAAEVEVRRAPVWQHSKGFARPETCNIRGRPVAKHHEGDRWIVPPLSPFALFSPRSIAHDWS